MTADMAQTVTGKVKATIRHGVTVAGNPMVSVELDDGNTYRVQNDASIAWGIDNIEFRRQTHTFLLTRAGRIEREA